MMRLRVNRSSSARAVRVLVGGAAVLPLFAGALWAHAVVVPAASTTRAYETYTLRVPNEKDVPTTRIEITFPADLFVVSFAEVPGWQLDVSRDDTGRALRAVWTGALPPNRFVELPFVGVNPAEPTTLVWEVDQVYERSTGEEVVSWSGPADSRFPASRTEVTAPGQGDGAAGATASAEGAVDAIEVLPPVAILVSVIALVVAVRALRSRSA